MNRDINGTYLFPLSRGDTAASATLRLCHIALSFLFFFFLCHAYDFYFRSLPY